MYEGVRIHASLCKDIHGDNHCELDWIGNNCYSLLYRILGCDINLYNLFFDAIISPKVADFGLAKISDRKQDTST